MNPKTSIFLQFQTLLNQKAYLIPPQVPLHPFIQAFSFHSLKPFAFIQLSQLILLELLLITPQLLFLLIQLSMLLKVTLLEKTYLIFAFLLFIFIYQHLFFQHSPLLYNIFLFILKFLHIFFSEELSPLEQFFILLSLLLQDIQFLFSKDIFFLIFIMISKFLLKNEVMVLDSL